MSGVYNRWELVEPALFARCLREADAFERGATMRRRATDVEALLAGHYFEASAIAHALDQLGLGAPPLDAHAEPVHKVISDFGKRLLVADGDHWALRIAANNPGHEIVRWRGVTMLVPPSIVVAGALSGTNRSQPCWVHALPESIAPRGPVGHLHVHLGPMLPFEVLWAELSNTFVLRGTLDAPNGSGIDTTREEDLPEIGRRQKRGVAHRGRGQGMRWQWMLELAFIARVWLSQDGSTRVPVAVREFSRGRVDLERRTRSLLWLWSAETWRGAARRQARAVANARVEDERQQSRDRVPPRLRCLDDEVSFLTSALRRCAANEEYARIFYQYLRVKVALYRSLVVDPWTTGLRHFLDVVRRDERYTNAINAAPRLDDSRLQGAEHERPLRIGALEIHITPKSWLKRRRRLPHERHSWVLSFVRAEQPDKKDPSGARAAAQWRRMMAKAGTMCRILSRQIQNRPSLLHELRGISVMDWERNGPVWLFEAPFRRLIEASSEVAAEHPCLGLRPIQTALHLGEDFDHLLSGLRQIYEPFEWNLIQRGDRIGHALALGLSIEEWCTRNPWIRMRPWDRLLDIGFVYWAFRHLKLSLAADYIERIRLEARDALNRVFPSDEHNRDSLETARDLWLSLSRVPPRGFGVTTDRLAYARELRDRVMDEPACGRRALSLSLPVETKHDVTVLTEVRDAVRECVAKWHVAIEVNPSSNLLIGGFRSIFAQPVFHTSELPITINTDDPLTFATTLADEYAYAWAGMVLGSGQSPELATRRLEEAARCSMRYTFTTPRKDDAEKR